VAHFFLGTCQKTRRRDDGGLITQGRFIGEKMECLDLYKMYWKHIATRPEEGIVNVSALDGALLVRAWDSEKPV